MMIRKVQAVGVELLLGLIAIVYGIHGLLPNKSLLYRLLTESGAAEYWAVGMVAAGAMLIGATTMQRRSWRVMATVGLNIGWCMTGWLFIHAGEYGPPLFNSVIFFVFLCLISLENWE